MASPESEFWRSNGPRLRELAPRVRSMMNPAGDLSWADVAAQLGTSVNRARMKWKEIRHNMEAPASDAESREVCSPRSTRLTTLEQLLEQCDVDLSVWEVDRWVANKWEVGSVVDGQIIVEPLYQVKAWLKRSKPAETVRHIWDAFLSDLKAKAPAAPRIVTAHERHDYLLEIAPVDAHFGKLAWAAETGESYDLKFAREAWREAITDLNRKASGFPLREILLVVGNDGMHFDNYQQTTTGGTFQDADTRYPKMFTTYWQECRWAVDELKRRAPVRVVVVPGNHDKLSAFAIGSVLEAWYTGSKDPRVTVDNAPRQRKYHRFGVTLLGFTHGSEEKHDRLPLIMASEAREDWSQTAHHEWHTGHFHKAKETRYIAADSFDGVRVRILPSLSAHDAWHYSKGYSTERRCAEAYLFHHASGYVGHFSSNILEAAA